MTDYKQLCAELVEDLALWLEYDGPPSRLPETEDESYQLLQRARAALAEPKQEIYYEFSVLNNEYCTEAGGTAPTLQQAVDEGRRYFAEYSQDGNYTLKVCRVEVIPIDHARTALAEPEPDGLPVWTEAIYGDGAVFLKDGVMVPIEEVVRELNRGAQARAALAQPEPEGPTDQEIEEWADACPEVPLMELDVLHGWQLCFTAQEFSETIRAAIARWGNHPGSPDSSPPLP